MIFERLRSDRRLQSCLHCLDNIEKGKARLSRQNDRRDFGAKLITILSEDSENHKAFIPYTQTIIRLFHDHDAWELKTILLELSKTINVSKYLPAIFLKENEGSGSTNAIIDEELCRTCGTTLKAVKAKAQAYKVSQQIKVNKTRARARQVTP